MVDLLPERLRRTASAYRGALVLAAICNVVLLGAYLWSQGGQGTTVRIEVRGSQYDVYIDGSLRNHATLPRPTQARISIFEPNERIELSTLPQRGAVRRVRVVDDRDGRVVFDQHQPEPLQQVAGRFRPIVADIPAPPGDFMLEVEYRNSLDATIEFTGAGQGKVTYSLNRMGLDASVLDARSFPGDDRALLNGGTANVDALGSARLATAAFLRGYPVAVVACLLGLALGYLLKRTSVSPPSLAIMSSPRAATVGALLLAGALAVVTGAFIRGLGQGLPHVADEAAYIFQARILASGRTHLDTPPVPAAFQFSYTPFLVDYDGRWASFYTFGHSLALAPGALIGAPWVVPPLVAGVGALLMFAIGRRQFGPWTGLLAAALYATSPFVLMQAGSYMSHNTAALYSLGAILAALSMRDRPLAGGLLAGILFGLFFNTRPLPAVAMTVPFGALLVAPLSERSRRRIELQRLAAFAGGGGLMLAAYVLYNLGTTGSAFENGYQAGGDLQQALGFGGAHSVAAGIDNEVFNVAVLVAVLSAWPGYIGLAFALIPFVCGDARRFEWFLLASAVAIIASAALFYTTGPVHGPRYVYEATPLLLLLTARGFGALPRLLARGSRTASPGEGSALGSFVVAPLACALVAVSVWGWLLGGRDTFSAPGTPAEAAALKTQRSLDDRLIRSASAMNLHDALVVVTPCDFIRTCYLSVFLENDLDLDGDVVWVYDIGPEANLEVEARYPCRNLYTANYQAGTLTPAGRTPPAPGDNCDDR